jgi:hypothetical protein
MRCWWASDALRFAFLPPFPFLKRRVLFSLYLRPLQRLITPPSSLLIPPSPFSFLFFPSFFPSSLSDARHLVQPCLFNSPVAQHNRLNPSSISPGGVRSFHIPYQDLASTPLAVYTPPSDLIQFPHIAYSPSYLTLHAAYTLSGH